MSTKTLLQLKRFWGFIKVSNCVITPKKDVSNSQCTEQIGNRRREIKHTVHMAMSDQRAMHTKKKGGNVQCISMAHWFSVSRNTDHKWNPSSIDSKHKNLMCFRGQSFHPNSLPFAQSARSHILSFPRQPDDKVYKTSLLMSWVRQSTDYRTSKHLLYKLAWSTWECVYHRA